MDFSRFTYIRAMSIGDLVSGLVFGLYRVLYIMGYSLRMREGVVETIQ